MWDSISQVAIFSLGTAAIILVAEKNKWGFVLGLVSQPFWIATSIINHQSGVFALSIISTLTWAWGVYQWFWGHEKKNKSGFPISRE